MVDEQNASTPPAGGGVVPTTLPVVLDQPVAGRDYLLSFTGMASNIQVTGTTNAPKVRIALLRDDPSDPDFPASVVGTDLVTPDPTTKVYTHTANYTGTAVSPPTTGPYKVMVWPAKMNGDIDGYPVVRTFQAVSGINNGVVVSAKCCMWFAMAGANAVSPFDADGETPINDYRPQRVRIPVNASDVVITGTGGSDAWNHGGSNLASGPAGRDPDVGLQTAGYQHWSLNSEGMPVINTKVCTLIGMWRDPSGGSQFATFAIGNTTGSMIVPGAAKLDGNLYLAMHDGKRWFNNGGSVTADITWT